MIEDALLPTQMDSDVDGSSGEDMTALMIYSMAECVLSIHISLSNLLVLWVWLRTRSVRTVTNTYIASLALTDFLAGTFGIPLTVYSVLTRAPRSFYSCLFVHLILCILCTISTFHMLAIAFDKYITICRGNMFLKSRRTRAVVLLSMAWTIGTAIAILPLFNAFGFAENKEFKEECHFTHVMDYNYLVYVIFFGTIVIPTFLIIFCYGSIHARIRTEELQVKCLLGETERRRRMNGRRKLIRILLILVLTYGICWYPLYLMNTATFFLPPPLHPSPNHQLFAVVLSHLSCALNPIIYAFGMPGYKKALRIFFHMHVENDKPHYANNTSVYGGTQPIHSSLNVRQHSPHSRKHHSAHRKISAPPPMIKRSMQQNVAYAPRRDTLVL